MKMLWGGKFSRLILQKPLLPITETEIHNVSYKKLTSFLAMFVIEFRPNEVS